MLTSEHEVAPPAPDAVADRRSGRRPSRRLRALTAVLGLLGAALALAFPFLPVVQDTATIVWPSPTTGTQSVDAPLVEFRPQAMSVAVGCDAIRSLDARTAQRATLISTTPPLSPNGPLVGLVLTVDAGRLQLTDRGLQAASGPVPPGPCTVSISSTTSATTVDLGQGQKVTLPGDARPQVVGIYSDLDAARDPMAGTSVSVTTDTRFQTSPTTEKLAAGILAALCVAGSVWALHRLDRRAGRRSPRWAPRRWWRPTLRDGVVVVVLAVWAVIGSQTSDDGYILGIARARESAGYIGNYYRWFNVPEAPFGWFYELYAVWVRVSDTVLWMRLPSLLLGIVSWLLISREMLPRLGQQVRRSHAAGWAAALVFLMFWLPYNNGLRPEPVAVVAGLIALIAVERAVATRQLAPVAVGLLAAALALAATPTGLISVATFLAAARPLVRLFTQRVREVGFLAVVGPILGAGLVVLVVIYADQTYAAVAEASRVRFAMGPNYSWFQEFVRYQQLFSFSADGSLARRAPVLLLFLGLVTCLVVLLRRDRIRGAATGPAQRLIGSTLVGFLILSLTPTKWTHHFGAFAALGAGMAALTALATSSEVLRSWRNRSLFLAAVFGTLALAFTGPNTWWYTNAWGVPWWNSPPEIDGYYFSDVAIALAALFLLIAGVEHIRGIPEERRPRTVDPASLRGRLTARLERPRRAAGHLRRSPAATRMERRARALRIGSAPIALIAGFLVLFEVWSMGEAVDVQKASFSLGGDVLEHPFGGSCGLADHIYLEGSPLAGALPVAPTPTGLAPSAPGVLPVIAPPAPPLPPDVPPPPPVALPAGVYPPDSPQAAIVDPTPSDAGFHHDAATPPTGGGSGVSGNEYTLRNNLAPFSLGSYDPEQVGPAVLRTDWFSVDDELRSGRTPLVVTAAGRLNGGNILTLQYAQRLPDGRLRILGQDPVDDGASGEAPWREIRVNLASTAGARADEIRLVAQDRSIGPDGWLAVAPMRGPQLVPMTAVAGHGTPMYLEWPVQFASPCLRPFDVTDGIAEVPRFRLTGDASQLRFGGEVWSSPSSGGPLGWTEILAKQIDVPSYLRGEANLDWGRLTMLQPYAPNAVAPTVVRGTEVVSGSARQGEIGAPPPGFATPDG